ncbi:hypothetical protein NIES2119_25390 [[Phormidium ambiguum] IAM M-71]|uniref:Uncharacterized protein n=1 Tax=[Phormidium ambiguum] IAM M-71 TaxID=454136 RepID=A0A1U7I8M3_9CYAN|nr:hypothetical protein [Phormidium ambiguum]OKH32762.1 hypothetical protein NIES2119_25390 [Phormidium ambiguum IAM M-71]
MTLANQIERRLITRPTPASLLSLRPLTPLPTLPNSVWYLGIDLGTTGLAAVLFNKSNKQVYPISWSVGEETDLPENKVFHSELYGNRLPINITGKAWPNNFKTYLNVTLPCNSEGAGKFQPVFKWSKLQKTESLAGRETLIQDVQEIELKEVIAVLIMLLSSFNSSKKSTNDLVNCSFAEGLNPEDFANVIENLAGVFVSCPAGWSEAYRFNVREVILASGLVNHGEQICFVEEAIASLLTELHFHENNLVTRENFTETTTKYNSENYPLRWQGETLVINSGANATELALVNIPEKLPDLTYQDFNLRSFSYAGNHLDQDIVCQLLLNGETEIEKPLPGEPDLLTRQQLQMRLSSSEWGETLLSAASYLKVTLPQEDSFTFTLGEEDREIRNKDLEKRVISRFVQSLNRELNTLLTQAGSSVEAITQVLCTGKTTMIPSLTTWLRQKFPNAKVIQEAEIKSTVKPENRVATGLAILPLYPQILDSSRQQYNDYFLLLELLRTFDETPLSIGKIINLLERKGINTRACQQRLFALLAGELPAGLVPSDLDAGLLTEASWQNTDYQVIRAGKLFREPENQTYSLNSDYAQHLRRYLTEVLASTSQKLTEPYTIYWLATVEQ